jgi:hypothetical protein
MVLAITLFPAPATLVSQNISAGCLASIDVIHVQMFASSTVQVPGKHFRFSVCQEAPSAYGRRFKVVLDVM